MTPLQVIMLTHEMRRAQKAFNSALKGESPLMDRHAVMVELEERVDAALEPYVNYARSFEMQEAEDADG
jgi:hypothetical protein